MWGGGAHTEGRGAPPGAALTGRSAAASPRPTAGTAPRAPAAPAPPLRNAARTARSPAPPPGAAPSRCRGSADCRSAEGRGGEGGVREGVRSAGRPHGPAAERRRCAAHRGGAEAGDGGAAAERGARRRAAVLRGCPAGRGGLRALGGDGEGSAWGGSRGGSAPIGLRPLCGVPWNAAPWERLGHTAPHCPIQTPHHSPTLPHTDPTAPHHPIQTPPPHTAPLNPIQTHTDPITPHSPTQPPTAPLNPIQSPQPHTAPLSPIQPHSVPTDPHSPTQPYTVPTTPHSPTQPHTPPHSPHPTCTTPGLLCAALGSSSSSSTLEVPKGFPSTPSPAGAQCGRGSQRSEEWIWEEGSPLFPSIPIAFPCSPTSPGCPGPSCSPSGTSPCCADGDTAVPSGAVGSGCGWHSG